jgi:hypothetical protein
MTPASVTTASSANKVKKAKQLSGTASASNKSRFMAKCLFLASLRNRILARLDVRTTLSKKLTEPEVDVECTAEYAECAEGKRN